MLPDGPISRAGLRSGQFAPKGQGLDVEQVLREVPEAHSEGVRLNLRVKSK